ncbi:hypothetical protein ACJMK2_023123 [Sinanodonta woodiana]|uniref:Uncharacterized protein n=1 Tax=Sinanodonta woodiana TaxID=1069815 RepID=A0ABD3T459_SINWO
MLKVKTYDYLLHWQVRSVDMQLLQMDLQRIPTHGAVTARKVYTADSYTWSNYSAEGLYRRFLYMEQLCAEGLYRRFLYMEQLLRGRFIPWIPIHGAVIAWKVYAPDMEIF